MQVNILIFGQLTEIAGTTVSLNEISDTDSLTEELNKKFPALANVTYRIAVNKKMVIENTVLTDHCTVALLPPFSGG